MDWPSDKGNVFINERGIKKTADKLQDGSPPVKWESKYGSVTFNMEGKFSWFAKLIMKVFRLKASPPLCGLNEKGLWGGGFWVHPPPAVKYPAKDGRASLNDYQLLEYLLDTSLNVAEAVNNLKKARVSGFNSGGFEVDLHWFLADASGDSVIIEFPDGKLKVHRRPDPAVITNSFLEHSREYLSQFRGFSGNKVIPLEKGETTSENRYVFAAYSLGKAENENRLTFSDVFKIMKSVTQTNVRHAQTSQAVTQWTAVYDLQNKKLWWFSRTDPTIKSIDLSRTDLKMSGKIRKLAF
jgi:choloylglycine hydrolase